MAAGWWASSCCDDAIDLPSFTHPRQAAYVLGAERASLSPALLERCDFVVRIPTKFCVNVAIAGALVMYDRMISLGRFAERPVRAGGAERRVGAPSPWRAAVEAQAEGRGRRSNSCRRLRTPAKPGERAAQEAARGGSGPSTIVRQRQGPSGIGHWLSSWSLAPTYGHRPRR